MGSKPDRTIRSDAVGQQKLFRAGFYLQPARPNDAMRCRKYYSKERSLIEANNSKI